jgi:hypothetical protein
MEPLTPFMLVTALKGVKETHLAIVDLSWTLLDAKGKLDPEKANLNRKEIDLAADQATNYVQGVRRTVNRILRYKEARSNVGN